MDKKIKTAAAALVLAVASGGASAQAQDFAGAFAGVYGISAYSATTSGVGLRFGYSGQANRLVFGGEIDYFRDSNGDYEVFVNLRGGYAVTDQVLGFLTVGRGQYNSVDSLNSVGIGAEYLLNDGLSLRLDYERHNLTGVPVFSGPYFLKLGASWNF